MPTCHRVFGSGERRQSASQAQAVLRVGQDPFPPGPRTQTSDTWEVPVCVAPCKHQREVGKGWSALHSLPPTLGVLGFSSGVNCILIPKKEREEREEGKGKKEGRVGGRRKETPFIWKKMVLNEAVPIHLVVIIVTSVSSAIKM